MRRYGLAAVIQDLVGGPLEIEEAQNGWPTLGSLDTEDGALAVALFVGPIGSAHRPERIELERRFQNPAANDEEKRRHGWTGRPIIIPDGRVPLLIGVWTEDEHVAVEHPVLVSANARKREGVTTRYSVFQRQGALEEAARNGWAEGVNDDGERMVYFDPRLLPVVATTIAANIDIPTREIVIAVEAAGLVDARRNEVEYATAGERARRSATVIVRDARFSFNVTNAYDRKCAMCGLGLRLVQGAHIYPASAPGSPDETWNGLCLCANHHTAFDRQLVWVDPQDRSVRLHPEILACRDDPSVDAFVSTTADTVREPLDESARPRTEMFEKRYSYYSEEYRWATDMPRTLF